MKNCNSFKILKSLYCLPKCIVLLFVLVACSKGSDPDKDNEITDPVPIDENTTTILLEVINESDGKTIPVYLALPTVRSMPLKTVLVLHGSGGPWDDDDLDGDGVVETCNVGTPSRQTREWRDLLVDNGFAAVFADSYSPRNTCENEDAYKYPPLKFVISGTFIRNRDAYAILSLLKRLVWQGSKLPVIDHDRIALVGFSDGGTSAESTLYDVAATPASWQWKQSFSGTTYTAEVLPPPEVTETDRFVAGVFYYPGSFHNSYYGNICNGNGIYKSYCDVLFHLPEEDALTENSKCLIETMIQNGGGVPTVFDYEGLDHGFDDDDTAESELARSRTLAFILSKMN